jgi:hypothetical protein
MKEKELRACATCGLCKKKVLASGMPFFYRVRIERHGVKMDAVTRQAGLEMMLGGSVALAQTMGADEDMTMPLMPPIEFTVCEACSSDMKPCCVAQLAEVEP